MLMRLPPGLLRAACRLLVSAPAKLLHARVAEQNLITAFGAMPPSERRAVLDAMFANIGHLPAEVLAAAHRGADFVRSRFQGNGIAKWRRLQEQFECGLVAITGHIGNWELLLQYFQLEGSRRVGGVVAKRITNPGLNTLVEEMRGRFGVPTLYSDSGVKAMAEIVRRGETIGLVPDQDISKLAGTFVPFFGRPAYTPTGPARLALVTGAPIVCAFCLRVGDKMEVVVEDPILVDPRAPRAEEVIRLTRAWNDRIEAFIRAHPEQWMWLHDRWRTTPSKIKDRRVD
jgi:KDO2-lipid IV(A) lauroyltransferase